MKKYLFLCFYFLSITVFAQQPQLVQERSYKTGSENRQISNSAFDKQGNILFSSTEFKAVSTFQNTFLLVKPNTDTIWTRTGLANLRMSTHALTATADGGFVFCGASRHASIGAITGLYMQKLSATGFPQWTKNNYFNNISRNDPNSIIMMPDKGYWIGGKIQDQSFAFARTDSLGNIKLIKDYTRYTSTSVDYLTAMAPTPSGNIIALGTTNIPNGPLHPRLLLLKQNGDSIKSKQLIVAGLSRYETPYIDMSSILPLSDGGYLFGGILDTMVSGNPVSSNMGMVVKVDSSLKVQWSYVHRTPNVDEYAFTKAKELADGTILILGFKLRPYSGTNTNGFQIYRFRSDGTIKDIYPFTSSICSQVWGITFDALADSTFMIGGRCGNNPPITFGFYVAKVKIPGLPLPLPPFTITGTKEETLLAGTSLGQSYPNPTAAEAIIPYSLPKDCLKASIIIREIATGREIRKYDLKRGTSSLTMDVGRLSSGLYLYSLIVDEKPIATKKLAVLK